MRNPTRRAKTTLRHIEVKGDETKAFTSTRVDQGWDLTVSGKGVGLHDGELRVEGLTFEYGPTDRSTRSQLGGGVTQIPEKVRYQGGGSFGGSATALRGSAQLQAWTSSTT